MFLRDYETTNGLGIVHAPPPVEAGDLVADELQTYRVEAVLRARPEYGVVPVLVRRVEPSIAAT